MRGSEGPGEVLSDDSVLPADSNPSSSLCVNKQDPKWFHQRCNVQCPHTKRKCMPQVCATAEDVNATDLNKSQRCVSVDSLLTVPGGNSKAQADSGWMLGQPSRPRDASGTVLRVWSRVFLLVTT